MLEPLPAHAPADPKGKTLRNLTIAALGVVYGDIGTSPLYALKESFHPSHGLALTPENVLGILSLVFWSLTLVVTIKYLVFIMRADNHGEGGIMALLGVITPKLEKRGETRFKIFVTFLALFGAALLYGDGVITPAISVLSAIEGLQVATPQFQPLVVPFTIAILIALFATQERGTAKLGAIFGRVTLVWFLTLIATGLPWIIRQPSVLRAINPMHAIEFFLRNGSHSYFVLGAVVLCITGGEALYADMGHFGRKPIRIGWFWVVFPALLVNYFGQGALVLEKGTAVLDHTFYGLVSGWMVYPLVVIATAATIIASQALISGAFSLTSQAVQLGYFPRLKVLHTSRETEGQIYVPKVNTILMLSCIGLVLGFRESSNLAAAYGIAVTATMAITSMLFYMVARMLWGWSLFRAGGLVALFLAVDLAFFGANAVKLFEGGWVPLLIAMGIMAIMTTWKRGRRVLSETLHQQATSLTDFIDRLGAENVQRVPGTAVFMSLGRDIAPSALTHYFKHSRSLHERVILITVVTRHEPEIPSTHRVRTTTLNHGFYQVVANYGYMQSPDISEVLASCGQAGLPLEIGELSFYLGRETILTGGKTRMAQWRKSLFAFFSQNARSATEYFKIPPDQVIEIGTQIRI